MIICPIKGKSHRTAFRKFSVKSGFRDSANKFSRKGARTKKRGRLRRGHGRVVSQYAFRGCFFVFFFRTNYSYFSLVQVSRERVYKSRCTEVWLAAPWLCGKERLFFNGEPTNAHARIQTRVQLDIHRRPSLCSSLEHVYIYGVHSLVLVDIIKRCTCSDGNGNASAIDIKYSAKHFISRYSEINSPKLGLDSSLILS